ncbi:putative quinol monooxygenase [Altererythrobacter arenosus]|uniref:Quinol monooxygenase n=1 Tax=Altererythrobacter arenosus TaxID=3032592 RepID=A0ABY8FRN7_9SPHN|nr:putative quinol monooxygenase [Altererythrobacter sp. CAU 1644]WFL77684.1 putative quinol monooxygenase [Altererythrobacter sp. CAU 1644]
MAKILISAQIDLDPAQRDEALRSAQKWIDAALAENGCIHYDWSADLNNPTRINVFEEWESEEALAAHFEDPAYTGMRDHIGQFGLTGAVSKKYRVDAEAPVYDETGVATAGF